LKIFIRIFVIFWLVTIAMIAISPFLLSSSSLPDDRLRTLPLTDLQACAKSVLDRYLQAGPQGLQQQKPVCYSGILLGPHGFPVAGFTGRKLSSMELHLVVDVEGSKSVMTRSLLTKTYVALPADPDAPMPYIYLSTVPLSKRAIVASQLNKLGRLLVVSGLFSCLVAAYFVRPIARLSHVAEQFGQGDLKTRAHPSLSKRKDEIGELGRTFNQMAASIESLVERYRSFLAHASHELGSPLTRLNIALALAKRKAGPQLEHELGRIGYEADRLNGLVQELLLLARLESGNELTRDIELFDIAALVNEACADVSYEAKEFGKSILIVRGEPFQMQGYRDLLRRALDNVLRNGLRFARAEGCVQVSYFQSSGSATGTILIQDDGPGIPFGQEEAIFEPFFTLPNKNSEAIAGGSGLGLAIARQAVLANRGVISAQQLSGKGLTLSIELPTVGETPFPPRAIA